MGKRKVGVKNKAEPNLQKPSIIKTVSYTEEGCGCEQPEKLTQKLTYSAQHQSPRLGNQRVFIKNIPNNPSFSGYARTDNIPSRNAIPINSAYYSCPCNNMPPPAPPNQDDLWDLQFCRWWGWNWVRKREEMLNQKRVESKMKKSASSGSVDKKRKPKKKKKRYKQNDACTWWNKLLKKFNKKVELKTEEKKQLQNLYDTPCSSVTFSNNCPCPIKDWECRSMKFKGDYGVYSSSTEKSSLPTVRVYDKSRRQGQKQLKRKHQSWILEKTESSSSEECCPCVSGQHRKNESSVDESVEYLSLRMAQIKADSEDDIEYCCPCIKLKEPHKFKLVREKQKKHLQLEHQNSEQKIVLPQVKVPHFRRLSPARSIHHVAKVSQRHKRKCESYPCCRHNKEYILYCPCRIHPRKKTKSLKKEGMHHCCCHCCCCKDNKLHERQSSESADNMKIAVPKSKEKNYYEINNQRIIETNQNPICCCGISCGMPSVSHAFNKGVYISPLTGKEYTIHSQAFTINEISNKSNLPKPLDLNEKIMNIQLLQSHLVDEEHKSLLNAVCEAIMSSRLVNKTSHHELKEALPQKRLLTNFASTSTTDYVRPKIFGTRKIRKKLENYLDQQDSNEVRAWNYESDRAEGTYQSRLFDGDKYRYTTTSQPALNADYRNVVDTKLESLKSKKCERRLDNLEDYKIGSPPENESELSALDSYFQKLENGDLFRSKTDKAQNSKIPVRIDGTKLLKQKPLKSNGMSNNHDNLMSDINNFTLTERLSDTSSTFEGTNDETSENRLMDLSFNSPQTWVSPPKFSGISITGLLSAPPNPQFQKTLRRKKYKVNLDNFKKHKLYNVFFEDDRKPEFPEDFSSSTINFHHLPNCPLVLEELPVPDVTQATQTQGNSVSTSIDKQETEKELQCVSLSLLHPCGLTAQETANDGCSKAQTPICPKEMGVNTTITCSRQTQQSPNNTEIDKVNQYFPFITEHQLEQEIFCTGIYDHKPKQISDVATTAKVEVKDNKSGPERTCLFLQHQQQQQNIFKNPDLFVKNKPESVVSVINRISEESLSEMLDMEKSGGTLSETPSFLSFMQNTNKAIDINPSLTSEVSEEVATTSIVQLPKKPPAIRSIPSEFKVEYTAVRKNDRPESDYYIKRKVTKKESPFSLFCAPVLTKSIEKRATSSRGILSRPERQMVLNKSLKEREKKWKY